MGIWFIPLTALVIVAASNAVNLTDGLDGLAGGCLVLATAAMTLATYAAGHAQWAAYLNLPPDSRLRRNRRAGRRHDRRPGRLPLVQLSSRPGLHGQHRAIPLGGLLGLFAAIARQELLLLVVGGVFVAEAGSVILQVACYKWRRRQVFLSTPLHHHFQFQGWPESKIVVRFWIAAALCALLGLAGLKLQ